MQRRENASADAGQIGERGRQPDIGDVGDPRLVEPVERSLREQVGIGPIPVGRVGGENEAPFELAQQGLLAHDAQDPLLVDRSPAGAAQRMRHAAVAVAGKVQHDPLDGIPQCDLRLRCPVCGERMCIIPAAADAEPAAERPHGDGRIGLVQQENHRPAL